MKPALVGLSGRSGAGKDTAAALLVERYGFERIAIADPLKRVAALAFGLRDEQLWGEERNALDERWGTTPRVMYQQLGDGLRAIHPAALTRGWIDAVTRARESGTAVVVPDVRMPSELQLIRNLGGVVWRVVRPDLPPLPGGDHATETALDNAGTFDAVLLNDGSVAELHRRAITLFKTV